MNNNILPLIKIIFLLLIVNAVPFDMYLHYFTPLWGILFFSYWLFFYGRDFVLLFAFIFGLILDVSSSDLLGQNTLALLLASGFLLKFKREFLITSILWQQMYILVASFIYLFAYLVVYVISFGFNIDFMVLFSGVITAVLWGFSVFISKKHL
ncbi:Rod shape-determining protein MreD [hydrothermal vent metagenome]|uniref:Rod shape-determining protein MreD n=1 Tax=hydrothermal vent metagenome TaxID=652676 RepID=A0A1W1CJJ5_9ZZZZ